MYIYIYIYIYIYSLVVDSFDNQRFSEGPPLQLPSPIPGAGWTRHTR